MLARQETLHKMNKPRACCVPCCKEERFTLVHKFPCDNERAEQWRRALAIESLAGLPIEDIRKRYYVCSRHFRDSDYKNKASRNINTTAVPSINLFALDNPEGLNRKIPSPVRLPTQTFCRGMRQPEVEEVRAPNEVLVEQVLGGEQRTIELIKTEEFIIPDATQHQHSDKSSSITYELNNFIDESFTSDPTINVTTMAKSTLLAASPAATPEPNTASSSTISNKRTMLKRPYSKPSTVGVPRAVMVLQRENTHHSPPIANHVKLASSQQTLPPAPASPAASETVVLKRVKITSLPAERKQYVASCSITQTDDLRPSSDKASTDERRVVNGIDNVFSAATHTNTSTKVLALLECTSENLQRLQRKMNDNGGALCLEEHLLSLGNDGTGNEGDKAMSPNKAERKEQSLTIRNEQTQETASVSYVWLRDHCRCAACYNGTTYQRSFSILELPLDIQPSSCNINSDRIEITWKDGHQSSYDLREIFDNQLDNFQKRLEERRSQLVHWDRALVDDSSPVGYASVTLNELLCEDDVMRKVVGSLVTYGFAFITKVPPNQQSTEIAVKRIFQIQRTLFGEMWTFSDDRMEHSDTAYTNAYLGPHTDNTYFNDAAGLLVLHCIQFNGTGAETILVDGFRATDRLRVADPAAFERLCSYPLEAEYIEQDKYHRYVAPVIRRAWCSPSSKRTGDVEQIRFNPYDRAPLRTLAPDTVPQFYADYQRFAREVHSEELQWKFQLTPGTVLLFDNWRVLHGRMAYSGKRVMTGCYVARTEYQSVARTMGLIE